MPPGDLCNQDKTFAPQMKRGLILSAILGLSLLSTGVIPRLHRLPAVRQEEVRPPHSPSSLQVAPRILTGELSVVHFVHRIVSVQGIAADQAYRLFAACMFLGFYVFRMLSSNRAVRFGLAAFSLLGAAGCLSDVISYWVLGGVVDWIGVNGHSAFAPSDVCWSLAPMGILLIACLGLTTFNASPKVATLRQR
jgi:hypothetical protein